MKMSDPTTKRKDLCHARKKITRTHTILHRPVLLVSAAAKALDFRQFIIVLQASRLVPVALTGLCAQTIIAVEISLAVALLVPTTRRFALGGVEALMLVFACYNLWRIGAHVEVPCHCFGTLFVLPPPYMAILDIALFGLCVLIQHNDMLIEKGVGASGVQQALCAMLACLLGLCGYQGMHLAVATMPAVHESTPADPVLSLASFSVQGPWNDPWPGSSGKDSLVLFGDLSLNTSRQELLRLCEVAARRNVRLYVRPLEDVRGIDSDGRKLAYASAAARLQGKFWNFVLGVCRAPSGKLPIGSLATAAGLNQSLFKSDLTGLAGSLVKRDMEDARRMGRSHTLTVALCIPHGEISLYNSVAEVEMHLVKKSE